MSKSESPPPTPPPGGVFENAERAVEYVRRAVGITLDYRPETLPVLDHYLAMVPRDQPETVTLVAVAAGCYFGEVVRRAVGGEWRLRADDAAGWSLVLPGGVTFTPVGWSATAIQVGEVDGFDGGFEVPAAVRATVEEALLGKEVPEDEYYSLSGRLEALFLLLDVVASASGQAADGLGGRASARGEPRRADDHEDEDGGDDGDDGDRPN